MTDNRTSQAIIRMENGMYLKGFADEALAICKKYRIMEEAIAKALERMNANYPEGSAVAEDILREALSFDPLP